MTFLPGFDPGSPRERAERTLAERFGVPPFSVLDARSGYWQERKRAWLALGLKGEKGRSGGCGGSVMPAANYANGGRGDGAGRQIADGDAEATSVFDPVLCELVYSWFSPSGGLVLDPFAGGSVRGIVASRLGRRYLGIELRPEQIEANEKQAAEICRASDPRPEWVLGDARDSAELVAGRPADFVFSCPPYGDLEVYSDDPRDLSTLPWERFGPAYRACIAGAISTLRPDRFACFVVGDFRARSNGGHYRGFPELTVAAMSEAGAHKYNEMILVTPCGSLPIRIGKQFPAARKVGKTHQNVLVGVKGEVKAAVTACGPVEIALDAWATGTDEEEA